MKRHLKITTTNDKVTVDAYQDVKSYNFIDNVPYTVNGTVVGESNNVSSDGNEDVATFPRNALKTLLLLLAFGICACIYGST